MKILTILAIVLAALFLLGQIRVGCQAEYSAGGPVVKLRIGALKLQVFPAKPKEKKPAQKKKKAKKTKEKPPVPLQEKVGGALSYAKALLPIVLDLAGQFTQRLQVDKLRLVLTAGGADPADAAMLYGNASAALGAFWHPLTQAFHVKDGSARVDLDFDRPEMTLYAFASLSLKIGQILKIGVYFGMKALFAFLSVRKKLKTEKQRKAA